MAEKDDKDGKKKRGRTKKKGLAGMARGKLVKKAVRREKDADRARKEGDEAKAKRLERKAQNAARELLRRIRGRRRR